MSDSQQTAFFAFSGGLDEVTQPIVLPNGRLIASKNYEAVVQGYARCDGYERFDGQQSPTDIGKALIETGQYAAGKTAIEQQRALIQPVPGSGNVLGVWAFGDTVYAFRNSLNGLSANMYRATAAGWAPVDLGSILRFTSGGAYQVQPGDTIVANSGGGTAKVAGVVVTSGDWSGANAAGYLILTAVTGTFTPGTLKVGGNGDVATFAAAPAAQSLPPGGRYQFVNHNFYGAPDQAAMYGVNGVGTAFAFDGDTFTPIFTNTPTDTPFRVGVYKNKLFLAFPGGSLQGSQDGDPLLWDASVGETQAVEFAMGDEITGLIPNSTSSFIVLTASTVSALTGNDATDFVMSVVSDESGAKAYTAQRMSDPLYMDNRGLRKLSTTSAYGNFKTGVLTTQVDPFLAQRARFNAPPVASTRVRSKDQYRLFFADGTGLSIYLGRKNPEPMPFDLGIVVQCIGSFEIRGIERIFFGAPNGYVYELDVGSSFDGAVIEAIAQTSFIHEGSPRQLKRWHKAIVELIAVPETKIGMVQTFDYANNEQGGAPIQLFDVQSSGGTWNIDLWDLFQWSAPVEGTAECWLEGMGRNMSMTIVCKADDQRPHILQGMTLMFSYRGQAR